MQANAAAKGECSFDGSEEACPELEAIL